MKNPAGYFDIAQITLYLFWIFFTGLILYLVRENKREGYPLDSDRPRRVPIQGFLPLPEAKTYLLPHGAGTQIAPRKETDTRALNGQPVAGFPGAPLSPTGNPMQSGIGPGAWVQRADVPDLTTTGSDRIVPLRIAGDFHLETRDPDPRGMQVVGADGFIGGKVTDAWVDRSEYLIRYLEVEVAAEYTGGTAGKTVLLPINFTSIDGRRRLITVSAILSDQFGNVPSLKTPTQVTRLEEERICAYYGGGLLYATRARAEPML
ncbi:MAG: photosynthetic reaction center subunit H [Proteobacteria bacterium]|nr:photosynthetic reaction center subunit H [Pseudomonadota bacterium]